VKIAVSADNDNGLDSVVSPHFGRCPYFAIVDVDGRQVESVKVVANPYFGHHQPGQVPTFIQRQGANVMLTGGMGGRAIQFFAQFGIEPATGAAGTVRTALERYFGGELRGAAPCRESEEHGHGDEGYEQDDVGRLREEAEMLQTQLDEVTSRLDRLTKG
jgi:predicted Fe-Mo cluster-binding NifX family protein